MSVNSSPANKEHENNLYVVPFALNNTVTVLAVVASVLIIEMNLTLRTVLVAGDDTISVVVAVDMDVFWFPAVNAFDKSSTHEAWTLTTVDAEVVSCNLSVVNAKLSIYYASVMLSWLAAIDGVMPLDTAKGEVN